MIRRAYVIMYGMFYAFMAFHGIDPYVGEEMIRKAYVILYGMFYAFMAFHHLDPYELLSDIFGQAWFAVYGLTLLAFVFFAAAPDWRLPHYGEQE